MTVATGKKRVQVTLGADVLAQLDVLAARRHQHRGHLIEAVLRRFLSRDLEDALPRRRRTRARSTWRTCWRPRDKLFLQTTDSPVSGSEGALSAALDKRFSPRLVLLGRLRLGLRRFQKLFQPLPVRPRRPLRDGPLALLDLRRRQRVPRQAPALAPGI